VQRILIGVTIAFLIAGILILATFPIDI
jgi:hypothetical protein